MFRQFLNIVSLIYYLRKSIRNESVYLKHTNLLAKTNKSFIAAVV